MRATYFLPRGLASSGFSVQKGSWHPSKCTWLKISSVILKVTRREPHVLGLLSLLASYYSSWGAWKKNAPFEVNGVKLQSSSAWMSLFMGLQIHANLLQNSAAEGWQIRKDLHRHYHTPAGALHFKKKYREKMFWALCISPGLPDKQLRSGNSWLCCRLSLNQSWEDSPYWH